MPGRPTPWLSGWSSCCLTRWGEGGSRWTGWQVRRTPYLLWATAPSVLGRAKWRYQALSHLTQAWGELHWLLGALVHRLAVTISAPKTRVTRSGVETEWAQ
jgi:hypothetical protein